jgi:hypothetical protein
VKNTTDPLPISLFKLTKIDGLGKSQVSDGFEKSTRSRLGNPEE